MKKKLSFQKKIVANLNPDQMNSVNGGLNTGMMCPVYPKPTMDKKDCNIQSNATLCVSVNVCHSRQWC